MSCEIGSKLESVGVIVRVVVQPYRPVFDQWKEQEGAKHHLAFQVIYSVKAHIATSKILVSKIAAVSDYWIMD